MSAEPTTALENQNICICICISGSQWDNRSRKRLLVQPFTTGVTFQKLTLPPSAEQQDVKSNQAVSESWDKGLHTGTAGQTHICSGQPHSEPDTKYADCNTDTNIRPTADLIVSHFILRFLISQNNPLLTAEAFWHNSPAQVHSWRHTTTNAHIYCHITQSLYVRVILLL